MGHIITPPEKGVRREEGAKMDKYSYVGTYSGIKFHFMKPKPSEVNLVDICKALSQINRYGGHTEFPYSVGQHSLLICEKVASEGYSKKIQLYALMHDFAEAYLTDLPTPIKRELPHYGEMEENIMNAIYKHFKIDKPTKFIQELVKYYDTAILESEVKTLCPNAPWTPPNLGIKFHISPMTPKYVELNLRHKLVELLDLSERG